MRYALILLALGLAAPAAARPAPSPASAVDTASGAAVRSSCTLSQLEGQTLLALDCAIRDTRQLPAKRRDADTVAMIGSGAGPGLQVVAGKARAAPGAGPDLVLHAQIDTRRPDADDAVGRVVRLDAAPAAPAGLIEVIEPRS